MTWLNAGAASDDKQVYKINLPEQIIAEALTSLSEQTGILVLFPYDIAEARKGNAVVGEYTLQQALDLLLQGTGLSGGLSDMRVIQISLDEVVARNDEEGEATMSSQNESKNKKKKAGFAAILAGLFSVSAGAQEPTDTYEDEEAIEEIVVVGSNIRGARAASPVLEFDKSEIELTGATTLGQFFKTLPQNFGGGANENSTGSASATVNFGQGSSVNLRGLGSENTLVLVNGRRVTGAGTDGTFVDISLIPLQAIKKVEVLTDGASAIYGADAIAGVVNIVMQDTFEGAETTVRFGSVTDGDTKEYRVSQSLGGNWDGGYALLSYEYFGRDRLGAEDRNFADVDLPRTLLSKQERHSLFASINHNLRDDLTIFADLLYSSRESEGDRSSPSIAGGAASLDSDNDHLTASLGSQYDINEKWRVKLDASYSEYNLDTVSLAEVNPDADNRFNEVTSDIWSVDAVVDGMLLPLPGGDLRLALGANYREENLERVDIVGSRMPDESFPAVREVTAAFGELFVPLVGPDNRRPGIQALELSLAARYEDYSDFGSNVSPKFGLRWQPVGGLSLRGTWGESFRAPTLPQTIPKENALVIQEFTQFGFPLSITLLGSKPLAPETSTQWTIGFDVKPDGAPFSLSAGYFEIDYEGRIANPAFSLLEYVNTPERFGDLVVQDPGAEFVNMVTTTYPVATIFLLNPTDPNDPTFFDPDDVAFFMDHRLGNIAIERQHGIDLTLDYLFETNLGRIDLSFNGAYIETFARAATPATELTDVRNILHAPIDLRLRGSIVWGISETWSSGLFVNYQDEYHNSDAESTKISSWTTFGLNVRYETLEQSDRGFLNDISMSLNIRNLFDKDPPFVLDPGFNGNLGYDVTNGNPLGRFITVDFRKRW